jgi:hypothetical protein
MVKCAGVLFEPREFPCDFFLLGFGVHERLGIFGPNCTIEVLRERVQRVENTATIIRKRYAGKSGRIISLAPSLLY